MTVIITLTTDFGLRDPYVAEMKGVILGITRDVHIVDVTHDVSPHDIAEGALALEAAAPHFPRGTIHVAVVDPGVGTARRALAVVSRGSVFLGPDNGLFTPFLGAEDWEGFELTASGLPCPAPSRTFHGRDIFAPIAARVACGLDPRSLGPTVTDPVRLTWPEPTRGEGSVTGMVVHVDRFGNLITSLRAGTVEALGPHLAIRVGGRALPLVGTYGELSAGQAGALIGSSHRLEIAVRERRADVLLGVTLGAPVVVSRSTRSLPTSS